MIELHFLLVLLHPNSFDTLFESMIVPPPRVIAFIQNGEPPFGMEH